MDRHVTIAATLYIALGLAGVVAVPFLIVGGGLLSNKAWAHRAGLWVAALNILNLPLGTPVGAYAMWALSRSAPAGRG